MTEQHEYRSAVPRTFVLDCSCQELSKHCDFGCWHRLSQGLAIIMQISHMKFWFLLRCYGVTIPQTQYTRHTKKCLTFSARYGPVSDCPTCPIRNALRPHVSYGRGTYEDLGGACCRNPGILEPLRLFFTSKGVRVGVISGVVRTLMTL